MRSESIRRASPHAILFALPGILACGTREPETARESIDGASIIEERVPASVQVEGRPAETYTLAERMEFYGVPAVSVAVLDGGEIQWARGWGLADVSDSVPVDSHTRFQAASISKPVAAIAALQLVEEGLVDLDTDVNEYLTSWQVPESEAAGGEPVTLRRLLTHSAGLTVHGFPGYAPGSEIPSAVGVLDGVGNTDPVRVDMEPGSEWRYSGGGYTVMQQLVEDIRGRPFAEVMRDLVLGPAGMTESTYEQPLPEDLAGAAAVGYRSDGRAVEGNWHTYPEQAAAGLWTTPSDLLRYAMQVQEARAGEPGRILSPAMADRMLTPGIGGWGLGPRLDEEQGLRMFGHGGSNEGFRCQLLAFADSGRGVAVMTNSDNGGALAREVILAVAEAYGWEGPKPRTIVEVPLTEDEMAGVVGTYRVADPPPDFTVEVVREDDGLWLRVEGQPPARFVRTGGRTFLALGSDMEVTAEWGEDGRVMALEGRGVRVERVR